MSNFSTDDILKRIDRVSKENGLGDISSAIFNTYYGINHRGTGAPIPTNADQHGLTFFTRPNLNLSYDNIKSERIFLPLLDRRPNSMFRAIRLWLDPKATDDYRNPVSSPLVDPDMAFISILSNSLLSMSGWPDVVLDTYTSKEGRARESWSMGDGITRNFTTLSMQGSFRNMIGDPITLLFFYWVNYISLVYQGAITPKPECIMENEIDYMTRVYRLVLDPTRTYVRKISCCGAAFPTSSPIGASHNFSIDAPYNRENDQIGINFQMIGIDYLDPIVVEEFNKVVTMFNPNLKDDSKGTHIKLKPTELNFFNHRGYPWIDPLTYELEWYVKEDVYNRELNTDASILEANSKYGVVVNGPTTQTTNNPFDSQVGYGQQMAGDGQTAIAKNTV